MSKLKSLAAFVGYSSWFLLVFALLTWLTFPWSKVADRAVLAADDSDWNLSVGSLGSAFFGLKGRDISISATEPGEKRGFLGGLVGAGLSIDSFSVTTSLGGLLGAGLQARELQSGNKSPQLVQDLLAVIGVIDGRLEVLGGEIEAEISGDEAARLSIKATDIDLKDYQVSSAGSGHSSMASFSADPRGTLRTEADVTWHWDDPKKSSGNIDLFLDDLIISSFKAGMFGLPEMAFSRSEAHLKLHKGRAEFRNTVLEADEVEARIEGFVSLAKELNRSRLAIKVRFKLRSDLDGLAKVALGSEPKHKDKDGWYHYQLNGTVSRPRFRESPAAARRSQRRPPKRAVDDPSVSGPKGTSSGQDKEEQVKRKLLSPEDRSDLDANKDRLKEERLRRREDRKTRREELMKKRRSQQQQLDGEREGNTSASAQEQDSKPELDQENEEEEEDTEGEDPSEAEEPSEDSRQGAEDEAGEGDSEEVEE